MQQNATGILNVTVKNDGKYIRNMTCKVYDSNTEISATSESGGTFGFKLNVGTESKNLKVVATSTPLESTAKSVINIGTGKRVQQKPAIKMQIPAGTYSQTEFIPAMQFLLSHSNGSVTLLLGTLDGD